jgi:hypothetical protein
MTSDQLFSDRGSIAPLVAGYLALIILTILGSAAVGVSMIAVNRVQAVADAAVLYAHDRSITRGVPNQVNLKSRVGEFLATAPSAKRIRVESYSVRVSGAISELELCAVVDNPLFPASTSFCRAARAESFVIR